MPSRACSFALMGKAVSLRELDAHLGRATQLVRDAFESEDDEPALNFRALAGHLRAALALLGEDEDGGESLRESLDSITRKGRVW